MPRYIPLESVYLTCLDDFQSPILFSPISIYIDLLRRGSLPESSRKSNERTANG